MHRHQSTGSVSFKYPYIYGWGLSSLHLLSIARYQIYKKPPKILLSTFCASKSSITMTIIEEVDPFHLNILNCQCLISLTSQISVLMGLISFDIWSWLNTTILPTYQGGPNLLKSIRTIINICLVRLISNKIREILGYMFGPLLLTDQYQRWLIWEEQHKSFSDIPHFPESNQYNPRYNNQCQIKGNVR